MRPNKYEQHAIRAEFKDFVLGFTICIFISVILRIFYYLSVVRKEDELTDAGMAGSLEFFSILLLIFFIEFASILIMAFFNQRIAIGGVLGVIPGYFYLGFNANFGIYCPIFILLLIAFPSLYIVRWFEINRPK